MGIFSGYPLDFGGNSVDPYQRGILGLLARNGAGLPMTTQPVSGFPAPTDVSAVNRNGTNGATLVQTSDSGFGRGAEQQSPFMSLLSGIGSGIGNLFGGGATPASPGGDQQPQPAQQGPGLLDRLTAGATNFTTGGNPIAGLLNSINGLATGQRTDASGIVLQQQVATARALLAAGVPPAVAQAAALDPQVMQTIAPQLYTKPTAEKLKDALGNERIVFANPDTRTVTEPGGGGAPGQSMTGPNVLAPGVKQYDPYLPADQYLAQFSPDMRAAIQAYINGDVMPTGNPRQMGMANAAKGFAQFYRQKTGVPVDDVEYAKKRKM